VNNLQVKLIAPDGSEHLPYVMPFVGTWTQASMELAATRGTNNTPRRRPAPTERWSRIPEHLPTVRKIIHCC
jgi:hypothetical protein